MITIDQDAARLSRSPLNFDNYCKKYLSYNEQFIFPSPQPETLEKNIFLLLVNSSEKIFDQKYKYKPSYLSYDEYGTTILDKLLMYVNGVMCVEEFDLITVIIPKLQTIIDVLQDKFPKRENTLDYKNNLTIVNW